MKPNERRAWKAIVPDLLEAAFVAAVAVAFAALVLLEVIDVPALVAKIRGAG